MRSGWLVMVFVASNEDGDALLVLDNEDVMCLFN